jgi:hypothetical protein
MFFLSGLTIVVLAPGVPPVHKTLTPYLIERQSYYLLFQKKDVLLFMTCGISYGTVGHQTSGAGSNPYFP